MHPDLQNLEQFYIRTRADVSAGRLSGQEGIQRVIGNTITDASGRVWMVDHRSADPNKASFRAGYPGQEPAPADPSSYQPLGTGMASAPEAEWNLAPAPVFPVEQPEKKSRMKRDKSASSIAGGSTLEKLKVLPRWVWLAGAVAVVLLLVALRLLGSPTPSSTSVPGDSTTPTISSIPAPSTTATLPATTVPVPPVPVGELSEARIVEMVAALERLDATVAQTVVVSPIDAAAYSAFAGKYSNGERLKAAAAPIELAGTPSATVAMQRLASDGTVLSVANVMLVKDSTSGQWMFRELPSL